LSAAGGVGLYALAGVWGGAQGTLDAVMDSGLAASSGVDVGRATPAASTGFRPSKVFLAA
jgi:hypothetical protein